MPFARRDPDFGVRLGLDPAACSGRAQRGVPNDDKQVRPLRFTKPLNRAHHRLMDFHAVRLPEPYDQDAVMRNGTVFGETLVRCNKQPGFYRRESPDTDVVRSLIGRSAYVLDIVPECSETSTVSRGIFSSAENLHPSGVRGLNRCDQFLGEIGGIVQACQDVFAGERGILGEQIIDRVAIGEHSDKLVNRDSRPFHAGLAMTDVRVDGDSVKCHGSPSPPSVYCRRTPLAVERSGLPQPPIGAVPLSSRLL